MNKKHALVLGATGATGQELVKFLIQDPILKKLQYLLEEKLI